MADALADAVDRGELRPGERLPPQRTLASRLGFDLTTITKAYDRARRNGLIDTRGRAGSFVVEPARASAPAAHLVDTGMNCPPLAPQGLLQRALAEAFQEAIAGGDTASLQYQRLGGAPEVRAAGAALLGRIGLASAVDQVVVAAGGQNALHAALRAGLRSGDRVACGRFVYPGFIALAQRLSLELVPLPQMTAEALEGACREGPIQALYVVPTNNNPTTETVPAAERAAIAEAARRQDIQIIEDDAYGLLPADRLPPIASFAPERSWYILSTSKIVSPALRVAFTRAPGVSQALRIAADVHETAVMAPPINAAIVAKWLRDGTFDRLVAATRDEAAARQKLARPLLGSSHYASHAQGYHLWLTLPEQVSAAELSRELNAAGIGSVPSDRFAAGKSSLQALRISLGGPIDRAGLCTSLRVLEGHVNGSVQRWDALV
ncbi:aminotransferase-like domain-containing protein [Croceibacterium soli]|uniref:aminotransferase-like domain-containing protein n=1 Tax=Croceibacterium soli TaxID=1739690 RepID=UPI002E270B3F